jgi:hypothetical protein
VATRTSSRRTFSYLHRKLDALGLRLIHTARLVGCALREGGS